MKRFDISRLFPPGYSYSWELKFSAWGAIGAFLYSLSFFSSYDSQYKLLFRRYYEYNRRYLIDGAIMTDFSEVLGHALWGFLVLGFCMLILAALHYAYFYQGGRSIYLMKRLPQPMELHRMCLSYPAAAILACAVLSFVLLLAYYAYYMLKTPDICLAPGQWEKIWRVIK